MMTIEDILAFENFNVIYWSIAICMSLFWGFYGIFCEHKKEDDEIKYSKFRDIAAFISDFTWSFIGWCSLYFLLSQHCDKELVNLNIFFGIIAVVGITGYGSTIPEKINMTVNK